MLSRDKPEKPLQYDEEPLPHGYVSYSVTQLMGVPTGGYHVRQAAIYIPQQHGIPGLSVRIIADASASPLMISSVKINENVGGYMQIAIAAQTLPKGSDTAPPVVGSHHCNIVAIGRPISTK
jgi:hypothetical protein